MRKMLVLGVLMVAGVAGAVFAAQPRDEKPPIELPKSPMVVAEKPEAIPQPKPADKPVAYTSSPRLTGGWDLQVKDVGTVLWSPDGSLLAVEGQEPLDAKNWRSLFYLVKYTVKAERPERIGTMLPKDSSFVGFTPDGKQAITDLREYNLLSGYHRLTFWDPTKAELPLGVLSNGDQPLALTSAAKVRSIDFDGGDLRDYSFPTDGKTFRSLRSERDPRGEPTKIDVIEIDATTGKTGKTLLKLDSAYTVFSHRFTFSPDGKKLGVFTNDIAKIAVYDLDRGVKLSEYKFPAERPADSDLIVRMAFSQDGKRLVVARSVGQTVVLNADTGEALPTLEGLAMASTYPYPQAFSSDGRYLALRGSIHEPKKKGEFSRPSRSFLTVWDTQTGMVVKSWNRGPHVAFSPARPILAMVERNGDNETRIGFWDFAPEVEKK